MARRTDCFGFQGTGGLQNLYTFSEYLKRLAKKYGRDEQGYVEENIMSRMRLLVNQEHVYIKNIFKSKLENQNIIINLKHPTDGINPRQG